MMYFIPPESAIGASEELDDIILNYDVYCFDPAIAPEATVSLDSVTVDAIDVNALGTPQLIHEWTFPSNSEGWVFGSPSEFTTPSGLWEPALLKLTASNNTNTFGYWTSPADVVHIVPNTLYRAEFMVKTTVPDQESVLGLGLRINTEQFWAGAVKIIESRNGGNMSPNSEGKLYEVYLYQPQEAVGTPSDGLFLSFDLMNFDPADAANGDLILDYVRLEAFPVPVYPAIQ